MVIAPLGAHKICYVRNEYDFVSLFGRNFASLHHHIASVHPFLHSNICLDEEFVNLADYDGKSLQVQCSMLEKVCSLAQADIDSICSPASLEGWLRHQ